MKYIQGKFRGKNLPSFKNQWLENGLKWVGSYQIILWLISKLEIAKNIKKNYTIFSTCKRKETQIQTIYN